MTGMNPTLKLRLTELGHQYYLQLVRSEFLRHRMFCGSGYGHDGRVHSMNKKAQLSLTNPRDACEKFAPFT